MKKLTIREKRELYIIKQAVTNYFVGCGYTLYPLNIKLPSNMDKKFVDSIFESHKHYVELIMQFDTDLGFSASSTLAYKTQRDWFWGLHELLLVKKALGKRSSRRFLFC